MKSNVEEINSVQRKITIELTADMVNSEFDKAYKKIQRKAHIKGFRPGKAPLSIIRKSYGDHVTAEISENLIKNHLQTALEENKIRPISYPMVDFKDAPKPDNGFEFHAIVDIMPEVNLEGYTDVAISCENYEVTDDRFNKELETMRRRQGKTKALEADVAAADGHYITISHTAKEGEEPVPGLTVANLSVVLGEGELIEDLEKGIRGMKAGETKTINVKVPDDYSEREFAGKDLTFELTLDSLNELILPELNDEFAKDMKAESLDDLKQKLREQLEQISQNMRKQRVEGLLLDEILKKNPFDVPPSMVDQVIDGMINEQQWPSEEERKQALNNKELRHQLTAGAKRRVQNSIILWKVAEKEKIEVTDTDVHDYLKNMFPVPEGQDEFVKKYAEQMGPRIRENLQLDKALDFLIKSAKITDLPVNL